MIDNALSVGSILHGARDYSVVEKLHQGGFGVTYRATGTIMVGNIPQEGTFTIKEFFMGKCCTRDIEGNVVVDAEHKQMYNQAKSDFKQEAEILNALHHDNIVPVNEVFEQNNTVYYVMSYLGHVSLTQYVAEHGGALKEKDALQLMSSLTSAVAFLHNHHILHLDIKPDNIMMQQNGAEYHPVLIDFGQAIYFEGNKPKKQKGVGGYSQGFSPLELKSIVKTFDPTLDIYALAATLLYMLSGMEPDDASVLTRNKIYRMLPDSVSEHCGDAIVHAMKSTSDERTPNITVFQQELRGQRPQTPPVGPVSPGSGKQTVVITQNPSKKTPWALIAAIVAVVAIATVAFFVLGGKSGKDDTVKDTVSVSDTTKNNGGNQHSNNSGQTTNNANQQNVQQTETINQNNQQIGQSANNGQNNVQPVNQTSAGQTGQVIQEQQVTEPKPTPQPTSGTVNLGYATWNGGLRNGKPDGKGTMTFHSSHAVSGCSTTPSAGDYIVGFCEDGVLQSGALYSSSGEKLESFVR